jgi:hypothetical protein
MTARVTTAIAPAYVVAKLFDFFKHTNPLYGDRALRC